MNAEKYLTKWFWAGLIFVASNKLSKNKAVAFSVSMYMLLQQCLMHAQQ